MMSDKLARLLVFHRVAPVINIQKNNFMANLLEPLQEVLLMGPGPSCVPPEVYRALSRPTIGHLDPSFIEIMEAIKGLLRQVIQTENDLTIPISGTGSAGMETCFVNLIEPGDPVLVLINGVFGQRMTDVATRLRAEVDTIEFDWGTPVLPNAVQEKLAEKNYAMVAVVHAETSTGVCNPVQSIGELVRPTDALYLVDTVTSLGGMPVKMDEWGVDVLYSGTQKCLSCPPGLAPVSFSARAVEKLRARRSKVPNWYLDLTMIINYWEGATRVYHHTAPVNMLYGLYQALLCIVAEGLENVFKRHRRAHEKLVAGLGELGFDMLVEPAYRLPMLNAVKIREGIDEAAVRSALLQEHGIEVGAGLGPLAGRIWRIGLMGHTARPENVDRLLEALRSLLLA
jgi:alanine-glyoxylate transaminase/serine-glyoxylate transaminase/serine-pyruvate transaminase